MAEGNGVIYNEFKKEVLSGTIKLASGGHAINVILVTGHTVDIDTHTGYASVSGDEESGPGYTAGGETLTTQAVTKDNANNLAKFDADNVTWTALDVGTPSHAIAYDDTHASDCLIAAWEVTTASNGSDYTLEWNADGILTLT